MLDNARLHKTKSCLTLFEQFGPKFVFIPPYTPTLAPIELIFSILKKNIYKQCRDKTIILTKKEGLQ